MVKKIQIPHFQERLKQRANLSSEVLETFDRAITLVKKKKLHPKKTLNPEGKLWYKLYFEWCTFIYTKKSWRYFMITFYQKRKELPSQ